MLKEGDGRILNGNFDLLREVVVGAGDEATNAELTSVRRVSGREGEV